jgi:hypothetical protein
MPKRPKLVGIRGGTWTMIGLVGDGGAAYTTPENIVIDPRNRRGVIRKNVVLNMLIFIFISLLSLEH